MQELYNIQVKHSQDALVEKSLQILNKFLTVTYKKKLQQPVVFSFLLGILTCSKIL